MAKVKAPALVKRLTTALVELGYTQEEAQDMISNEGTASIAAFIQDELEFANKQGLTTANDTAKVTLTPTEDKDMAIKCTVGTNGKYTSVETIDTGLGVQAAKPLPKDEKQAPTIVEPTASVQKQTKPTASEAQAELMYDYNLLPAELQRIVDDINLHKLPTSVQLPVLHVVGWNQDTCEFIYKITNGQAAAHAYAWLCTTAPRDWQNIPAIVVAPTDPELLKLFNSASATTTKALPAQADYKLVSPQVVLSVSTLDLKQFQIVVSPAASTPAQSAKVAAKARKQAQEPAVVVEKVVEAKAKAEAKVEPISDALLQELASATNHMKRVSLVNKIQTALGLPKVASKITKAELQPTVDGILKQFSVAVPEPAPKSDKVAKAKVAKEPAAKSLTKGEIEKLWIEAHIRETGVDAKVAKKAFAALDVNWRSSKERADFCTQQGLV